jgi:energy-coupling factor transporter ATP-binding protein EcfA2
MFPLTIGLQNYRAFAMDAPIEFTIHEGITFLVGVNNIGKSALIRAFFELRPVIDTAKLRDAKGNMERIASNLSFHLLANRSTAGRPIYVTFRHGEVGWNLEISPLGDDPHTNNLQVKYFRVGNPPPELLTTVDSLFHRSMYVGPFRSPAVQVSDTLYDIRIGRNFVQDWDTWANGPRIDHSQQVESLIQQLRTLFGLHHFGVTVSQDSTQLYVTTDDGRFSLGELGDGIAHYVIVLGNAMIKNPAFIYIDEPEIGLHPRMQEIFVRALASKANQGVIATSHSVGLARSVADRLLTLTRDKQGHRRFAPFGEHQTDSLIQSISELGYSPYAEIGGNHLLLVEGRTDIKCFREILRKFGLEQHFLIWSLNGSDWIKADPSKVADELNELKRLNARSISVIFDGEQTTANAQLSTQLRRFRDLCITLGFHVFPTDRHSTENYITQAALDQIAPNHTALQPFEPFGANTPKWDKSKNWLIFEKMHRRDFTGTGLEEFLEGTLSKLVEPDRMP